MGPPPNLQPNPSRTLRRAWGLGVTLLVLALVSAGLWGTSQIVINHISTRSSP